MQKIKQRKCSKCGKDSQKSYCKDCNNAYSREYYVKNRERLLKQCRERNPEQRWEYNLKRWYNITAKEYYDILDQQNGCCAICKTTDPAMVRIKKFHVDHCHTTGKIRGLLCAACNHMIGCAKDNPNYLRDAADYLE